MKTLSTSILILSLLLAAANAQAGRTFLVQQDTDKNGSYSGSETLGRFTTFSTTYSIKEFYGYIESGEVDAATADRDSSYDDATDKRGFWGIKDILSNNDLAKNQSHLFLVDAYDGLGLFIVHNKMGQGAGGTAEMQIDFSPSGQLLGIEEHDDAGGRTDDEYDDNVVDSPDQILAQWQWGSYYSDGLAAKWEGEHLSYAEVRFTDLSNVGDQNLDYDPISDSFDGWKLHSPGIVAQSLTLELDAPVRLTLVPLPPAAWPAVAMLGVLALRKLRTRRLNQSEQLR